MRRGSPASASHGENARLDRVCHGVAVNDCLRGVHADVPCEIRGQRQVVGWTLLGGKMYISDVSRLAESIALTKGPVTRVVLSDPQGRGSLGTRNAADPSKHEERGRAHR